MPFPLYLSAVLNVRDVPHSLTSARSIAQGTGEEQSGRRWDKKSGIP